MFASATEQPWSVESSRKINDEKEINRTCECMTVYKRIKSVAVVVAEVSLTATV
jgi:AICAR transformylase/IMP cyclohydrolase PurH